MQPEHDSFGAYHRARWRAGVARIVALAFASVAAVGIVSLVEPATSTAPHSVSALSALDSDPVGASVAAAAVAAAPVSAVTATDPAAPVALAAPATPATPATTTATTTPSSATRLPNTGPASWSISIDTRGHQKEIDQCLWVRMDVGGHAPIVGAHNYCGGEVVLDMVLGDAVTLSGTDLEGTYFVSDAGDARAGDPAARAIAGLTGEVIMQTCYGGGDGRVRLVGLSLVSGGG